MFGIAPTRNSVKSAPYKMHLAVHALNQGGYDRNGDYFGLGVRLWKFWDDEGDVIGYVRNWSRSGAKAEVRSSYPAATFYR